MDYYDYSNPNEDNLSIDTQDKKKNLLDDVKNIDTQRFIDLMLPKAVE